MSTRPDGGHAGRSRGSRDAGALTVGTIVSGIAAYAFIAVGTRVAGASGFAPVSILWTLWAATAAFITFPVQHWAVRTIEADGHEGGVRATVPTLVLLAALLGLSMTAALWWIRVDIFGTSAWQFPVLSGVLPLGSVAMGLNRGVLSGRRRFVATSFAIVGENAIRLIAASAVALVGGEASVGLGVSIVLGFAVALFWPGSFVLRAPPHTDPSGGPVGSPLRFLGGVAGGSLASQLILTSGPLVLAWLGGAAHEVTGLFAALAIARAPYMVSTGVAPRITSTLTTWAVSGEIVLLRRLRNGVAMGAALAATAVAGLAWLFGQDVMRAAFGEGTELAPALLAPIAGGAITAIAALVITLILIARGTTTAVTVAWLASTAAACVVLALGPPDALTRVVAAIVLAQVVAAILLWVADVRYARGASGLSASTL